MQYMLLFLVLFLCSTLQVLISMKQNRQINFTLKDLQKHTNGHLGVGIGRAKFNAGRGFMLMVVTDKLGQIIDIREMKGMTSLATFHRISNLIGRNVQESYSMLRHQKERLAFEQAIKHINVEREKAKLPSLAIS